MAVEGSTLRQIRSLVLFVFGLAGITYETLTNGTERPTLLVLFAACLGLPAFLGLDERRTKKPEDDEAGEKKA